MRQEIQMELVISWNICFSNDEKNIKLQNKLQKQLILLDENLMPSHLEFMLDIM